MRDAVADLGNAIASFLAPTGLDASQELVDAFRLTRVRARQTEARIADLENRNRTYRHQLNEVIRQLEEAERALEEQA